MTNTERANYLRHIKRLQLENRVLRSVVTEERLRRQRAYGWYVRRLNSRMMWLMDVMLFTLTNARNSPCQR